jgi:hypothetical protein
MGMQAFGWLMFVRVEVTGQARRPLSGCKPWVQQPELRKRKSISAVKSLPQIVFLSVHFFFCDECDREPSRHNRVKRDISRHKNTREAE